MTKKKSQKKENGLKGAIASAILLILASTIGITVAINTEHSKIEVKIDYAPEPALFEGQGEYEEEKSQAL